MNKTISDYMSEQGRKGGAAKTAAKAAAAKANGAKGGRPRKIEDEDSSELLEIVTVHADDGAEQTFAPHDLGLSDGRGYTRKEWLAALVAAGYDRKGIVRID